MAPKLEKRPHVLLLRPPGSEPGRLAEVAIVAHIPVADVEPVPGALEQVEKELEKSDWIVFTSPRAPQLLAKLLEKIRQLQAQGRIRVAAVGPKTRQVLEQHGIHVDYVPREYRGAALAEELASLRPHRVLLPRSEKAVPDLVQGLESHGIEAVEIPLYRVVVLDRMASAAARAADLFDYVVFTSPSIAEAFTKHYPSPNNPGFKPIAIGPTTAKKLKELGYPEAPYPSEYTLDGVAKLIIYMHSKTNTSATKE